MTHNRVKFLKNVWSFPPWCLDRLESFLISENDHFMVNVSNEAKFEFLLNKIQFYSLKV